MKRHEFLTALGSAVVWPAASRAQTGKVHTILWATEAQPDPFIGGFREGMRELGYVKGKDLTFVLRYAPGIRRRYRQYSLNSSRSRPI